MLMFSYIYIVGLPRKTTQITKPCIKGGKQLLWHCTFFFLVSHPSEKLSISYFQSGTLWLYIWLIYSCNQTVLVKAEWPIFTSLPFQSRPENNSTQAGSLDWIEFAPWPGQLAISVLSWSVWLRQGAEQHQQADCKSCCSYCSWMMLALDWVYQHVPYTHMYFKYYIICTCVHPMVYPNHVLSYF